MSIYDLIQRGGKAIEQYPSREVSYDQFQQGGRAIQQPQEAPKQADERPVVGNRAQGILSAIGGGLKGAGGTIGRLAGSLASKTGDFLRDHPDFLDTATIAVEGLSQRPNQPLIQMAQSNIDRRQLTESNSLKAANMSQSIFELTGDPNLAQQGYDNPEFGQQLLNQYANNYYNNKGEGSQYYDRQLEYLQSKVNNGTATDEEIEGLSYLKTATGDLTAMQRERFSDISMGLNQPSTYQQLVDSGIAHSMANQMQYMDFDAQNRLRESLITSGNINRSSEMTGAEARIRFPDQISTNAYGDNDIVSIISDPSGNLVSDAIVDRESVAALRASGAAWLTPYRAVYGEDNPMFDGISDYEAGKNPDILGVLKSGIEARIKNNEEREIAEATLQSFENIGYEIPELYQEAFLASNDTDYLIKEYEIEGPPVTDDYGYTTYTRTNNWDDNVDVITSPPTNEWIQNQNQSQNDEFKDEIAMNNISRIQEIYSTDVINDMQGIGAEAKNMLNFLNETDFKTGFIIGEANSWLQRVMGNEDAANYELFEARTMGLILNASESLKGALSARENDWLEARVPSIRNTPEANKAILQDVIKFIDFKVSYINRFNSHLEGMENDESFWDAWTEFASKENGDYFSSQDGFNAESANQLFQ